MSRQLEIRRHTDNDGDVLSKTGVAHAVRIGREELLGGYSIIASSGAQRATQTAACMLAGLGEPVEGGAVVVAAFRSEREDEWRDAYAEAGSSDLDAFREVAPDLVAQESDVLAGALRDVLDQLREGERALVIGHSPTSEAAVLGMTGKVVGPLGKGEGVLLTLDGDRTVVEPLD